MQARTAEMKAQAREVAECLTSGGPAKFSTIAVRLNITHRGGLLRLDRVLQMMKKEGTARYDRKEGWSAVNGS